MQNARPTDLASAAERLSPVGDAINRVIALAPAPLLPGEKQADYAGVAARIVKGAQPRDAIEDFLIRDVVDLTWEILRLRRVKTALLKSSRGAGVSRILEGVGYPCLEVDQLCEKWAAGDDRARKKVDDILSKAGLTIDEVTAQNWTANSTVSNGSIVCWRVPRRVVTTHCAKLIVTETC
jgi:hypothetical protein